MSARIDVLFRLIDEPDGQLLGMSMLVPNKVDWERNRPGEADTLKAVLPGHVFPFDLGIIAAKSMFVRCWLFEHQNPARCLPGDRGYYFGVVDDVKRRRGRSVELQSRDMTAIPLDAKMSEGAIKAFAIDRMATVEQIVDALIHQIPGTQVWRVESLCASATRPGVPPPIIVPAKPVRGSKAPPPPTVLAAGTAHLSDIVSAHEELSVWTAICNVCARHGVVPEVIVDAVGPKVVLVDGSDLHTTDIFRPFVGRFGKPCRVFVDGDGICDVTETLTLSNGPKRPEFIQIDSYDPARAVGLSARWPPKKTLTERKSEGEDKTEEGLQQFVRGVTSEAALQRMARAGWEALAHNGFEVEIEVSEPWSAGGGPDDPDFLDLGYGAACECRMPSFDALTKIPGLETAQKVLEAQRVQPELVRRILRASERLGAMSLVFQASKARLSWAGGKSPTFRGTVTARRFLGTADLSIYGDSVNTHVPQLQGVA